MLLKASSVQGTSGELVKEVEHGFRKVPLNGSSKFLPLSLKDLCAFILNIAALYFLTFGKLRIAM